MGDFGEQILKSVLELLTSCLADGNIRDKIFYYEGCRREVRLFCKEEGFNERRI